MSKRILVVEDQPDNRQIIRDMVAGTDYEITEAENGEEALAAIAKQRPDLILDIQVPIMDGYTATRLIKTDPALRSIPIIAVTSYALAVEEACCCADRTLSVCNVGDCALKVTSVHFKRRSRHWKILHNPFPAKLRPGSCLPVVIQYHATEKVARACELVIESDDPAAPVKIVEVLAYTIWDCGCKEGCGKEDCDDCRKNCCDKHSCCRQGYPCCDDDDDEDRRGE
jgi:CheY-like chemotaxis protein